MDKGYRKHHNSLADHKQPGYDTHSGRQSRAGGSVTQEIAGRVAQAIAKQDRQNRAEARKNPQQRGHIQAGSYVRTAAQAEGQAGGRTHTSAGRRPAYPPLSETFGGFLSDPVALSCVRKTPL